MQNRTTTERRLNPKPEHIVRDKQYYFNTLDLEADLLKKASDIAERMMVAFMRENRVEVSLDVDDISNKIIEKILDKMPQQVIVKERYSNENAGTDQEDSFSFDDGPVIIKTDKIKVHGNVGKVTKTKDSIDENLDILENLDI